MKTITIQTYLQGKITKTDHLYDYINACNRLFARSNLAWNFHRGTTLFGSPTTEWTNKSDLDFNEIIFQFFSSQEAAIRNITPGGSITNDFTGVPIITNLVHDEIPPLQSPDGQRLCNIIFHELTHIVLPFEGYHMLTFDHPTLGWDWRKGLKGVYLFERNPELLFCPSVWTAHKNVELLVLCPLVVKYLEENKRQPWNWKFPTTIELLNNSGADLTSPNGQVFKTDETISYDLKMERREDNFHIFSGYLGNLVVTTYDLLINPVIGGIMFYDAVIAPYLAQKEKESDQPIIPPPVEEKEIIDDPIETNQLALLENRVTQLEKTGPTQYLVSLENRIKGLEEWQSKQEAYWSSVSAYEDKLKAAFKLLSS